MTKYILTALDTTGIQKYIFGSNNLKQIVGASAIVNWATKDLVYERLEKLGNTNIENKDINGDKHIDEEDLKAELIYAGGGNTLIIFKDKDIAINFIKGLTKKILTKAHGLDVVCIHREFEWDNNDLAKQIVPDTLKELSKKKMSRQRCLPVMGLGVTADCHYTGLPAVEYRKETLEDIKPNAGDGSNRRVSREVSDKLKFYNSKEIPFELRAKKSFTAMFDEIEDYNYEFFSSFNDIGSKHESSFMAVVHADGNGMGKRVIDLANNCNDNREYITNMRAFSISVQDQNVSALKDVLKCLIDTIEYHLKEDTDLKIDTELKRIFRDMVGNGNKKILPFRPIIVGGDDITFVCDGRLGLTLTELYLRKVTGKNLPDGKPISARAGVAIVKSHYPFSRAVDFAEELAASAKDLIKENETENHKPSAMDWHFAAGGTLESLKALRERSFTVSSGKLYMRPVFINNVEPPEWQTWNNFVDIMDVFNDRTDNNGKKWKDSRNKLKFLREALLRGEEEVKRARKLYDLPLIPTVEGHDSENGWIGDRCTCFDAIEAYDFFIPLKEDGE